MYSATVYKREYTFLPHILNESTSIPAVLGILLKRYI